MSAHRYACHGIVLQCNLALTGPLALETEHADVRVELRTTPRAAPAGLRPLWTDDEGECLLGRSSGEKSILVFPGVAQFEVNRATGSIVVYPLHEDASGDRIQHLLLNHVVPLVLAMDGACILHGAALEQHGEVVAVLGASGRGKSTLALALARRGARLLGDDAVQVARQGTQLAVIPSYPAIRLWDEDAKANDLPAEESSEAKRCLPAAALGLAHAQAPHRLRAIHILRDESPDGWRGTRLRGSACFDALLHNAFLAEGLPGASVGDHMELLGDIAAEVPIYALHRGGRDAAALDRLALDLWERAGEA